MNKRLRHNLMVIFERFIWLLFQTRITVIYRLGGLEEINRLLLTCNPKYVIYLLSKFGARIGKDNDLRSPLLIQTPFKDYSNLIIGDRCHIGKDAFLDLHDKIVIEDEVTISMRTTILTHIDLGQSPLKHTLFPTQCSPVIIKSGSYVGAGVIILQGVSIGELSVVGAGAVVVNDVPDSSLVVGVPAKLLRSLKLQSAEQISRVENLPRTQIG